MGDYFEPDRRAGHHRSRTRHFGALMGGAQIAIRSGQTELALEFVEAALEVSPNNPEWLAIAEYLRGVTGAVDL